MKTNQLWGILRPASRTGIVVRIAFAALAIIGSVTLAFMLITAQHPKARAAGINSVPTTGQPWGLATDGANHLWVAEPNCDSSPVCTTPPSSGTIGEYDLTTMNKIADFTPPTGTIYTPIFLAVDGSNNIWFTDPSHDAIGEFNPSANTWAEYPIPYIAQPYNLVFDNSGLLWFTDYENGEITSFNTKAATPAIVAHAQVPSRVPGGTPTTILYGIAKGPDGKIWVAENNKGFIADFDPAAIATANGAGKITTANITETAVLTSEQHLITVDKSGNVWFSAAFSGQLGELPAGSNTAVTYCVSNGTTQGPHISGIGVDSKGNVWFDDSVNARVGYLTPSQYNAANCTAGSKSTAGVTYTTFAPNAHPHDGLLVDGKDNVWVTQQFASQLTEIPAGTALTPGSPTLTAGPVSKTWYFAEGRVGAGFTEYLTLGNPDPVNDCPVTIQYLTETGTPPAPKTVTVTHSSRLTESVNADLNTPSTNAAGVSLATLITTTGSTCAGVVAERPMYFNYHGDSSNTDVVGATHLASTFYFADVPSGNGYSSYLTILNPPGGQSATVAVNYFSGGNLVGTQTTIVAGGQRGTIAPMSYLPTLPTHVAAVVTSTAPIVVERPTYFNNIGGGIAGNVTGAASVVGSQALKGEWFFAEGYAGTSASGGVTQENLVISNVDPANQPASVTINLEYLNGTKHPFTVTVPARSQLIWDINKNGTGGASNEVSADVVSTGAMVVVSRQMYFHYAHNLNGTKLQVIGGTEVTGQIASASTYSFAEGYSNFGYNEWLTIQNPTAAAETIYIVMVNGYGRTFVAQANVGANTRFTQDISALVQANLVQPGDDHRGYEVSMTVETTNGALFVAERPMYANTNGSTNPVPTQGGNDAFGYAGG